jgi:uncharacterized protein (DUF2267 family)
MKKLVWTAIAVGGVVVLVKKPELRVDKGRIEGLVYRLRGGHPDPDVDHNVLADRIRSTLGPLEARLDLPHVHVMVEEHIALLHGDVATEEQADAIEAAVAQVSGVAGVESYLHIGLLDSDTRPSEGRRVHPPSEALRRLLTAAEAGGVPRAHAASAVVAVLSTFLDRLPAGEARHVRQHLPEDVRRIAALPRLIGVRPSRTHTAPELLAAVARLARLPEPQARDAVASVLKELRTLVPEEAADVSSVLPADLRTLWGSVTE